MQVIECKSLQRELLALEPAIVIVVTCLATVGVEAMHIRLVLEAGVKLASELGATAESLL